MRLNEKVNKKYRLKNKRKKDNGKRKKNERNKVSGNITT